MAVQMTWPRQECQTAPGNVLGQEISSKLGRRSSDENSSDTARTTSISEKWELSVSPDEHLREQVSKALDKKM